MKKALLCYESPPITPSRIQPSKTQPAPPTPRSTSPPPPSHRKTSPTPPKQRILPTFLPSILPSLHPLPPTPLPTRILHHHPVPHARPLVKPPQPLTPPPPGTLRGTPGTWSPRRRRPGSWRTRIARRRLSGRTGSGRGSGRSRSAIGLGRWCTFFFVVEFRPGGCPGGWLVLSFFCVICWVAGLLWGLRGKGGSESRGLEGRG